MIYVCDRSITYLPKTLIVGLTINSNTRYFLFSNDILIVLVKN